MAPSILHVSRLAAAWLRLCLSPPDRHVCLCHFSSPDKSSVTRPQHPWLTIAAKTLLPNKVCSGVLDRPQENTIPFTTGDERNEDNSLEESKERSGVPAVARGAAQHLCRVGSQTPAPGLAPWVQGSSTRQLQPGSNHW